MCYEFLFYCYLVQKQLRQSLEDNQQNKLLKKNKLVKKDTTKATDKIPSILLISATGQHSMLSEISILMHKNACVKQTAMGEQGQAAQESLLRSK